MSPPDDLPAFRLRQPRVPADLVARPRVTAAILATAPGTASVLACAPGYGVTTAVQQALAGSADAVAWVGLDCTVSDEVARGLLQASVVAPGIDVAQVRTRLAAMDSVWLVIDGLVPEVHQNLLRDLAELCADLPRSARLVITTAADVDLPGVRHFDEALLAFEPDEAFELITRRNPAPNMDDVAALIAAADGWASALIAGAHLMPAQEIAGWLRNTAARELLLGWFEELPADNRDLLTQTAVLEELHEGPVALMLRVPDAAERLGRLCTEHDYVRRCDPPPGHEGVWWRRHPLLTALLRQRNDPQAVSHHQLAAQWFRGVGDLRSAISHLIAGGQMSAVAELLNEHESGWLSTGEAETVLQWYDSISDSFSDRSEALLRVAWGQAFSRDIVAADASLAALRSQIDSQQAQLKSSEELDRWLQWDAEEALLRAYLAAYHGDPATVITAGRKAMSRRESPERRDADQLGPVLVGRGLMWSGHPEAAEELVTGLLIKPHSNDVIRELHLAGLHALALCGVGRVRAAQDVVDHMQRWIESGGIDPMNIQMFAPGLAQVWVDLDSGRLLAAGDRGRDVLAGAQEVGHLCDATWAAILLARIDIVRGDFGAAMRSLAWGRELALSHTADSTLTVPLDQVQALAHIAAGDQVRAERLIHALPPSATRSLLAARAGLSRQPVLTRRTLEVLAAQVPRTSAERHLLLAAVHDQQNRRIAQGHLRKAAAIAAENGMRHLLVPAVGSVLDLAQETALEFDDGNLTWLLRRSEEAVVSDTPQSWNLSRGELQLLTILPTRAKNIEIAELFGVSVNTVKTRLRRLYAKLDAANRDEAIERARERGLIQ